ncbi:MAG TPA: sigma-70 family RNA polymerase sigma factor [Candidatus Deferrimicrobium sp.]|nr:sigma-70 family RNA polymerase sigma factor [Candidatus Deferrimicrobium sp.]
MWTRHWRAAHGRSRVAAIFPCNCLSDFLLYAAPGATATWYVRTKGKNQLLDTDTELITQALAGSQKAFRELTERHRPSVFHIIIKIVRDQENANDLVQETFMKAFAALASYRPEYRFSTWLYKIAANSAIDHLRKRRIQALSLERHFDDDEEGRNIDVADYSYHPERDLERKEQRFNIAEAIASLPDKYREVIVYRHQDDKSYEEIADLLGVPIGTVKARIFRARELLKKKLKSL